MLREYNYVVLLIAIKYKKTSEQSFQIAERLKKYDDFIIEKYHHIWTKEQVEDLKKLRKEGLKYRELQEVFGCSFWSIRPNLKKEV